MSRLKYAVLPCFVMLILRGDSISSCVARVSRYIFVVAICKLFAGVYVQQRVKVCIFVQSTATKAPLKNKGKPCIRAFPCVGMTGLEPATSRPPDACANQLRYIPMQASCCIAGAKVHTFCEKPKLFLLFFPRFFLRQPFAESGASAVWIPPPAFAQSLKRRFPSAKVLSCKMLTASCFHNPAVRAP